MEIDGNNTLHLSVPTFLRTVRASEASLIVRPFIARTRALIPTTSWKRASWTTWRHFIFKSKRLGTCRVGAGAAKPASSRPRRSRTGPVRRLTNHHRQCGNGAGGPHPGRGEQLGGQITGLQIGPRRLAFTSETLILSFSLPNFDFHAVTAYDILRSRGVPLEKRDYEGELRTRSA